MSERYALAVSKARQQLDFVAVGPQKAGTTWLDEMLRRHPGVVLPSRTKETFFFDQRFEKGFDWYWRHFDDLAARAISAVDVQYRVGEVAPSYFADESARARLLEMRPDLKVIISLRDPVERCYSLYCHHYLRGRIKGTFAHALSQYPQLLETGRYHKYCIAWAKDFGVHNVLLVNQAHIGSHASDIARETLRFIGLVPRELGDLNFRSNDQLRPSNLAVARLAAVAGRAFRSSGLHGVANRVKQSVLYDLVAKGGQDNQVPSASEDDKRLIERELSDDIQWLQQFDGRAVSPFPATCTV